MRMEKQKLKLGKMTGKEIAKWLNISYGTYSNVPMSKYAEVPLLKKFITIPMINVIIV